MSALALATLIGVPAVAQDSGWYLGANAGQSRATIDEERIVDDLLVAGFAATAFKEDDRHFGFKAFGGYRINRYVALEGGYFDLGSFSFKTVTIPAGTLSGEIKIKGVNLDFVGGIPFTRRFAAYGRIGAIRTVAKDSFAGTGAVVVLDPNRHERAGNHKLGVGFQLDLTNSFAMRAEMERYRVDDAVGNEGEIDFFSLGALFRFGRAAPHTAPP